MGYSPGQITRLALLTGLGSVVVVLAAVFGLLVEIGQHDLALGIVLVLIALAMAITANTVTAPALPAARRDRKAVPEQIQGQLVGASPMSGTPGLAMVAVNVNRGIQEFRVRPALYEKLQGGAVVVGLVYTPGLQHVTSLTVIRRDRMAKIKPPVITRAMRLTVWLPFISIGALVGGLGLGGLIGALLPLGSSFLHPLITLLVALGLAALIALGTRQYARRLMKGLDLGQ